MDNDKTQKPNREEALTFLKAKARKHTKTVRCIRLYKDSLTLTTTEGFCYELGTAPTASWRETYLLFLEDYHPAPKTHALLIRVRKDLYGMVYGLIVKKSSRHYPTLQGYALESALG